MWERQMVGWRVRERIKKRFVWNKLLFNGSRISVLSFCCHSIIFPMTSSFTKDRGEYQSQWERIEENEMDIGNKQADGKREREKQYNILSVK